MKRKALITLFLGTALAIAPAAGASVVADTGGTAVQPPVIVHPDVLGGDGNAAAAARAVTIRGEALNHIYGNAVTQMSPDEFRAVYNPALSPDELAAIVARGRALNHQYGLDDNSVNLRPDVLGGDGGTSTIDVPASSPATDFPWEPALGGTLAALMLMTLASVALLRRRHQLGF